MYKLTFNNTLNELTEQAFDDSTAAVNAAVRLQVADGGYNTSTEWWYEVTDSDGNTVYADECMRHFD
ncbi:hypothetical protein N8306_00105 [Yoonia sp.]|nr:hypothetical protein [Yoonia sp.]